MTYNMENLLPFISLLALILVLLLLYQDRKPVHYRLPARACYTVCSVNGDDSNESIAENAPLATIREALKRGRESNLCGIDIVVLPGHMEYLGETPLEIDTDRTSIVGNSHTNQPTIVFTDVESTMKIIGSDTYFSNITFWGNSEIGNHGIVMEDAKKQATFYNCTFASVGCVYKAW